MYSVPSPVPPKPYAIQPHMTAQEHCLLLHLGNNSRPLTKGLQGGQEVEEETKHSSAWAKARCMVSFNLTKTGRVQG